MPCGGCLLYSIITTKKVMCNYPSLVLFCLQLFKHPSYLMVMTPSKLKSGSSCLLASPCEQPFPVCHMVSGHFTYHSDPSWLCLSICIPMGCLQACRAANRHQGDSIQNRKVCTFVKFSYLERCPLQKTAEKEWKILGNSKNHKCSLKPCPRAGRVPHSKMVCFIVCALWTNMAIQFQTHIWLEKRSAVDRDTNISGKEQWHTDGKWEDKNLLKGDTKKTKNPSDKYLCTTWDIFVVQ